MPKKNEKEIEFKRFFNEFKKFNEDFTAFEQQEAFQPFYALVMSLIEDEGHHILTNNLVAGILSEKLKKDILLFAVDHHQALLACLKKIEVGTPLSIILWYLILHASLFVDTKGQLYEKMRDDLRCLLKPFEDLEVLHINPQEDGRLALVTIRLIIRSFHYGYIGSIPFYNSIVPFGEKIAVALNSVFPPPREQEAQQVDTQPRRFSEAVQNFLDEFIKFIYLAIRDFHIAKYPNFIAIIKTKEKEIVSADKDWTELRKSMDLFDRPDPRVAPLQDLMHEDITFINNICNYSAPW